jgi:hypothetical protein
MGTVQKKELLERLEDQVESHIKDTIVLFQNRDDVFLNAPAANGGWSIAQCLDHLNSYGDHYLPRMREKLDAAPDVVKPGFTSTWFGAYFTSMMDPTTGKKKFKAFKGHIPKPQLDAAAVIAEFIRQQEDLLQLLRIAHRKDLDQSKVPISVMPLLRLKIGDVFQFLIAHNERHMQQAKRNLTTQSIY